MIIFFVNGEPICSFPIDRLSVGERQVIIDELAEEYNVMPSEIKVSIRR